jgi:hypothetical protein
MLRNNENKRGLSCRIKGHIEVKMHLGRGTFFCNTLNPCYRSCQSEYEKPQRGVLGLGRMRRIRLGVGET